MADISKIKTPNGNSYDIKDTTARNGGGVQLTQAQYDALVSAGTVDANTTYFITDGQNITTASAVSYNNTASRLSATNVQGAIDELGLVITGQATLDTAKINRGGIVYTKIGKIVIVDVNVRFNANIATDSAICSGLPRGSFVHFLLGVSQNIYRAYFDGTTIKMSDVPLEAYCTGMFIYKAN